MAIDRKISDLNPYPGDPQDGDLFITAREDSSNFKISFFDLSRDLTDRVSTFYLTGDQAVDGKKQFIQSIDADIDGNAETVTNGVYLIGDQTINGRKKFLLPITGDLSGVAKYVVNGVYITGDQIIGGNKKFLNTITGDLSGIARYVQDGAYITGNQTIEGIKTFNEFLNANVSGNLSGTARYVQHGVYVTGDQEISGIKTFKSFVNANISGNLSGTSRYVQDGVYLTGNQTIEGEKDFIGKLLVSGSSVITNKSAKDFLLDDAILLSNVDQISSGNKVFKGRVIPSGGITSTGNKPLHFTDGRSPSNFSTPDKSLTLAFQNGVYVSGGADLRVEGKIYAEEIETVESIVGDEGPMVLTDGRDPSNFVGPDKSLSLAFQNGVYVSGGADLRVDGKIYAEEIETVESIVGDEGPMVLTDGRDPSNFVGPDKSLSLAFQNGVYVSGGADLRVDGKIYAEEIETVESIVGDEGPMVLTDGRDPSNFVGPDKSLSLAFQNGVYVSGGADLRVDGKIYAEEIETVESIVGDEGPMVLTDGRDPSNFVGPDKSLSLAFQNGVYVSGGADLRVEGKIYAEEIETVESIVGDEGPMVLTDGRDPSNFVGPDKSLSLAFQNGVYVSGGADLRVEGKVYAEEIETVESIVGDEGPMVLTDGRDPSNFVGPDKSLSLAFQNGVYVSGGADLRVEGKVYAEEIETIENIVGDEGPMVFTDGRDPSNFIGPDKSLSLAFQSGVYITGSSSLNVEGSGLFNSGVNISGDLNVEGSGIFNSGVNISGDLNISGRTNVNELIVNGNINAKTLSVGEIVAYNYIYSSFRQSTSDSNFYIPLHVGEGAEETATPTQVEKGIAILCPRKGKISRIIFKQKGGGLAGDVSFAIQTSADYEQLGTSLVDQEVSSTQTVDKDIPYIYNFSNSQHFNSGNALFLNVRRSSNSVTNGDWVITAEVLYTID